MNEHFNKNLVTSERYQEMFQSSSKCWIFHKLFKAGDNKVRDPCHVTGKYRVSTHWSCNVDL